MNTIKQLFIIIFISYYFKRTSDLRGIYINNLEILRVGTDISGYTYESDASQTINMHQNVENSTRIWYTYIDTTIISVFNKGIYSIFYVCGSRNTYAHKIYTTSNLSMKRNIEEISNPLDKIMQLCRVTYNLKNFDEEEVKEMISYKKSFKKVAWQKPKPSFKTLRQMMGIKQMLLTR